MTITHVRKTNKNSKQANKPKRNQQNPSKRSISKTNSKKDD
jgi:hypothetical protein